MTEQYSALLLAHWSVRFNSVYLCGSLFAFTAVFELPGGVGG